MRSLARLTPTRRGQALRGAATGDDAEEDLGLPETGVFGDDAQVARQGELEATAERVAGDGRDRHPGKRAEGRVTAWKASAMRAAASVLGELGDVGSRREEARATPQDDRTRWVGGQLGHHVAQTPEERHRQRVHLGPVAA